MLKERRRLVLMARDTFGIEHADPVKRWEGITKRSPNRGLEQDPVATISMPGSSATRSF